MARSSFYGGKAVQLTIQPNIGLETSVRLSVIDLLNLLLADEAVILLMTQRMGEQTEEGTALELQPFFDAQYQQIKAISNEVAERILILGGSPSKSPHELVEDTRLGRERNTAPGIMNLLAGHEAVIRILREDAQKCSEMYEDQGTFALLVCAMRAHEKIAWLLRSNIVLEQFHHEK